MSASSWPIPVAAIGTQLRVGSTLWQFGGQMMVTAIAKATCVLAPGDLMRLVTPDPLRDRDEHIEDHPMRGLVAARELAPLLQRADVTLCGRAYAAAGQAQTTVRMALRNQHEALLDKSLVVYGDRNDAGAPQAFEAVELGYERAYGGIGYADNPIGTGFGSCADVPPNVFYAGAPERTASFAPIPGAFLVRKRLLGSAKRRDVEYAVAHIPADLDWAYFQAAPQDQQLERLHGDEWLMLEGMLPGARSVQTQLPRVSASARVYGHAAAGAPSHVPLRLDMLHIDSEAGRCTLVWRGSFPLMNQDARSSLIIAGALSALGEAVSWPASPDGLQVDGLEDHHVDKGATAVMDGEPGADGDASPWESTLTISEESGAVKHAPLPFSSSDDSPGGQAAGGQAAGGQAAGGQAAGGQSVRGTMPLSENFLDTLRLRPGSVAAVAAPFEIAAAGDSAPDDRSSSLPGAPWDDGLAPAKVAEPNPLLTKDTISSHEEMERLEAAEQKRQAALVQERQGRLLREEQRRTEEAERAEREQAALATEKAERERRRDEQRRAEEAAQKAQDEAEERRRLEAARFQAEQEAAQKERDARLEAKTAAKRDRAKKMRDNMYGGFKRKG